MLFGFSSTFLVALGFNSVTIGCPVITSTVGFTSGSTTSSTTGLTNTLSSPFSTAATISSISISSFCGSTSTTSSYGIKFLFKVDQVYFL